MRYFTSTAMPITSATMIKIAIAILKSMREVGGTKHNGANHFSGTRHRGLKKRSNWDSRTCGTGWQAPANGCADQYRAADVIGSGSSCGRRQRGCRPGARSSPARSAGERQPHPWSRFSRAEPAAKPMCGASVRTNSWRHDDLYNASSLNAARDRVFKTFRIESARSLSSFNKCLPRARPEIMSRRKMSTS